jgi:[ribosomal protein S18]-alanine N-acetyltransferase
MNCHLESASRAATILLSALHETCFPEDPWGVSSVTEVMGIPGFFGQVAWKGERPVGFVLALDLGDECEILSLGVVPEQRRAGIGGTLLSSACVAARLRGAVAVALEVAEDNAAARALYGKRDFTEVGRRPHYYSRGRNTIDALVLRRALATAELAT